MTIPIRVMGFDSGTGAFSEDTHTLMVNAGGALIALKHQISPGDTIRIVNLETYKEEDFKVVGLTHRGETGISEWGVECLERGRNLWGIDFPPPLAAQSENAAALLQCQACGKQSLAVLTAGEANLLDSTSRLERLCDQCGELSPWAYADTTRRSREGDPPSVTVTTPTQAKWDGKTERRAHKRLPVKVPVRIMSSKGEVEIAKTENLHKGGFGVCLAMRLAIGETVSAVCPYTEGSESLSRQAEVRLRMQLSDIGKWRYGFKYRR